MSTHIETLVVKASEMGTVFDRIVDTRFAAQFAQYEKDLKVYERALKRGKVELTETTKHYFTEPTKRKLYQVVKSENGVKSIVNVYRPVQPEYRPWSYSTYDRSGSYVCHA